MQCRQQQAGSVVCFALLQSVCVWKSWGRHLLTIWCLNLSYLPHVIFLFETVTSTFSASFPQSLYILFLWGISCSLSLSLSLGFLNSPSVCLWLYLQTFLSIYLSPFLLLLCFFLGAISDPFLSSLLPPCDCSHFLTLPRTRHTQPVDDPQKDPR